jgi:hypothetical protein
MFTLLSAACSLLLLCDASLAALLSSSATTTRNRYYQTQSYLQSQKFENVTRTLNKLLDNYDIRLRPKFGCKYLFYFTSLLMGLPENQTKKSEIQTKKIFFRLNLGITNKKSEIPTIKNR